MNRLAHWILRLYPAHWRKRYGDEVDALLTDAGADARTVADLAKGGVRMQFSTWSFPKLAVTLGLAGLLLGGALSWLLPSYYTSKATLQIVPARIDTATTGTRIFNPLNARIQELFTQVDSRARLAPIVQELSLYPEEKNVDDSVEVLRSNIHVTFVAAPGILRGASAFDIEFTYPDRYKAQRTVAALVNAFTSANQTSTMQDAAAMDRPVSSLVALDRASLPEAPYYSSKIAGLLASFLGDLIPHQYRSAATLRLNHGTKEQVAAITTRVLSRTYLSMVVNDPRLTLYRNELRTAPLEEVLRTMRRHIEINQQGNTFRIAFDYPDRYKARMTVETLMSQFSWASKEMFPVSARASLEPPMILDVLDVANLPSTPSKPNRLNIALIGGVLGVILGALISTVRRRWIPPSIAPLGAVNG